jgi:hypothetical protein
MKIICPRCQQEYSCDPRDAQANREAVACEKCVKFSDWRDVQVIGRTVITAEPIVLTLCCECHTNVTSGGASEAGTLGCATCIERLEGQIEGGEDELS